MPDRKKRLPENVDGDFYVDSSCIDCDACRFIAPSSFHEGRGHSFVARQPETREEIRRAETALLSCPTASIGTVEKHDFRAAAEALPERVADGVHFCGFTSESSYGALSWFVETPSGNILVDSPRFVAPLVRGIEENGGIRRIFLTHRDDIADATKFAAHFGAERIIHAADVDDRTRGAEVILDGDDDRKIADDAVAIMTPGHSRGSMCLLLGDRYLFTGDHLAYDPTEDRLSAFRDYCWFDWRAQTRSMEKLTTRRFEWVFPGHGRPRYAPFDRMQADLARCVSWMKSC
jgi:glyoxylase-like metal-dependent hydrolase (beta-lactamase superfamily II)/ferredoxin